MAYKSNASSGLDSDDLSLETTVPTDLSLSPDISHPSKSKVGRSQLEKKQLQHDLQVTKIELSQKCMLIDSIKSEYTQRIDDLQEQLADVTHAKQVLALRLDAEITKSQEEARKRQVAIQNQVEKLVNRQKILETQNEKLHSATEDIKKTLFDLAISEQQYLDLRQQNDTDIPLKEFVAMRLFEELKPWKLENEELRHKHKVTSDKNTRLKAEVTKLTEDIVTMKEKLEEHSIKNERLVLSLAEIKQHTTIDTYKVENYDRVHRERDDFEKELIDIQKRFSYINTANDVLTRERDELTSHLSASEKSNTLLKQDKDYMQRQLLDSQTKLMYLEERQIQLNNQLELAKQSREELYDKYVTSRDEYKEQYERKMSEQLDKMRFKTDNEIERLKTSAKEVYERENRSLREARDLAISERDRATASENELQHKYDQLLMDFRQKQSSTDQKIGELTNEVRLKAFEVERTAIVLEESNRNVQECQKECDKLNKKLEVMTKEYYSATGEKDKKITELQTRLQEVMCKLETYEKLENELDDVVMQAAESSESDRNGEDILLSYGYGANLPSMSKRRLQHSVQLARRVLQLEKECTLLKKQKEIEAEKKEKTFEQLRQANEVIDNSHQPYHYLVEALKHRDGIINDQKKCLESFEDDLQKVKKERNNLLQLKKQSERDIESLLLQNEELREMQNLINNLKTKKTGGISAKPSSYSRKTRVVASSSPNDDDCNVHNPSPTSFTNPKKFQYPEKDSRVMALEKLIHFEEVVEKKYGKIDDITSKDIYREPLLHFSYQRTRINHKNYMLAFKKSILSNKHLFKDRIVADISGGTGLFTIWALEAGAKYVFTFEPTEFYSITRQILKDNGYNDHVTVVPRDMKQTPLPKIFDILICDWQSEFIKPSNMINNLLFFRDNYLKQDGIILPRKIETYVAPMVNNKILLQNYHCFNNMYGLDMSELNHLARAEGRALSSPIGPNNIKSIPKLFKEYDAKTLNLSVFTKTTDFEFFLDSSSRIDGLLFYNKILFEDLHKAVSFESDPTVEYENPSSVIPQYVIVLKNSVVVKGKITFSSNIDMINDNRWKFILQSKTIDNNSKMEYFI
ncbi:DgyrCDS5068 [Dimorphilus gyrociliatus]|uniref:DgyrCDS5068 n=1 Tax=Dimorphilus gyrociliatus TaxID=2664684 RepID=A0A7I8VKB2_9ANNE|nr:DgyrCDS5068 [Dimorphilus gyrociliatus]